MTADWVSYAGCADMRRKKLVQSTSSTSRRYRYLLMAQYLLNNCVRLLLVICGNCTTDVSFRINISLSIPIEKILSRNCSCASKYCSGKCTGDVSFAKAGILFCRSLSHLRQTNKQINTVCSTKDEGILYFPHYGYMLRYYVD